MNQHPNARLTPRGRETLVSRIESGVPVAEAARQMGVSRQTASKRLSRSSPGEGLSDRSSQPRRLARSAPREVEDRVCEARSSRLLAPLVHVDVKKVARIPDGGGHWALGRGCGSARGAGAACLHVAVDDFSRVAYAELLPDERKGACAAFMGRCLRFRGTGAGASTRCWSPRVSATSTRGPTAPGRTERSSA